MYKLVITNTVPVTNDDGKQKHLLVSQKGGKRNLAIPCYKKQVEIIRSGLSFEEAKNLRKENKFSQIVKE